MSKFGSNSASRQFLLSLELCLSLVLVCQLQTTFARTTGSYSEQQESFDNDDGGNRVLVEEAIVLGPHELGSVSREVPSDYLDLEDNCTGSEELQCKKLWGEAIQTIFLALMERICELCHEMFNHDKPNMRAECRYSFCVTSCWRRDEHFVLFREDCFQSSTFKRCLRLFKPGKLLRHQGRNQD